MSSRSLNTGNVESGGLSLEEEDQLARNTKKIKNGGEDFSGPSRIRTSYADLVEGPSVEEEDERGTEGDGGRRRSYKESLMGRNDDSSSDSEEMSVSEEESDDEEIEAERFVAPDPSSEEEEDGFIFEDDPKGDESCTVKLYQLWAEKGILTIIDLSHDFFLVKFSSVEDYNRALMEGPWVIFDHYLSIRSWSPGFDPSMETIDKIAAWVRFLGIPLELFNENFLKKLGNKIGKNLKVDATTTMQTRGKYARVCMEIDLNLPLLSKFKVEGRKYFIEYESVHFICFGCGRYGHVKEGCPNKEDFEETDNGDVVAKNEANTKSKNGGRTTDNDGRKEGTANHGTRGGSGNAVTTRLEVLREHEAELEQNEQLAALHPVHGENVVRGNKRNQREEVERGPEVPYPMHLQSQSKGLSDVSKCRLSELKQRIRESHRRPNDDEIVLSGQQPYGLWDSRGFEPVLREIGSEHTVTPIESPPKPPNPLLLDEAMEEHEGNEDMMDTNDTMVPCTFERETVIREINEVVDMMEMGLEAERN
ncbi:hypothetical protein G2W53_007316 [Senna tora]|uniref:CCHC-type domain-containing protein n=1 Tax=Senna tora TaxID=362788 RepID=A0A834X6W6_9FABA|nr:hypothetical protein G2W53_007316 [Senna tora]